MNSRIAKIKRRLKAEDDIEPLMDVLRELDHDRKTLMKEIVTIKEELSSSDGLGPTQNLIGLMDTPEEREEIRQRIKGRIRELISSIVVEIKVDGHKRWAKVEVTLTTGIKRWILLLSNRLRGVSPLRGQTEFQVNLKLGLTPCPRWTPCPR